MFLVAVELGCADEYPVATAKKMVPASVAAATAQTTAAEQYGCSLCRAKPGPERSTSHQKKKEKKKDCVGQTMGAAKTSIRPVRATDDRTGTRGFEVI